MNVNKIQILGPVLALVGVAGVTGRSYFKKEDPSQNQSSTFVSPEWLQAHTCPPEFRGTQRIFARGGEVSAFSTAAQPSGYRLPTTTDLYRFALAQAMSGHSQSFCFVPVKSNDVLVTAGLTAFVTPQTAPHSANADSTADPVARANSERALRNSERAQHIAEETKSSSDQKGNLFALLSLMGIAITYSQYRVSQRALKETEARKLTDIVAMYRDHITHGTPIDYQHPAIKEQLAILAANGKQPLIDEIIRRCPPYTRAS